MTVVPSAHAAATADHRQLIQRAKRQLTVDLDPSEGCAAHHDGAAPLNAGFIHLNLQLRAHGLEHIDHPVRVGFISTL